MAWAGHTERSAGGAQPGANCLPGYDDFRCCYFIWVLFHKACTWVCGCDVLHLGSCGCLLLDSFCGGVTGGSVYLLLFGFPVGVSYRCYLKTYNQLLIVLSSVYTAVVCSWLMTVYVFS